MLSIEEIKEETCIEVKEELIDVDEEELYKRNDENRENINHFLKEIDDYATTAHNTMNMEPPPEKEAFFKTCIFCQSVQPGSSMAYVFAESEKFHCWKIKNDITIDKQEVPWVCKSHFKSTNFTKQGLLKCNAILSLEKPCQTEKLLVLKCVYCGGRKVFWDMINFEMNQRRSILWELKVGFSFDENEVRANPWICKSHFDPKDVTLNGKLRKYSVPNDYTPKIATKSCTYCEAKKIDSDLVQTTSSRSQLKKWRKEIGIGIHVNVIKGGWICKAHFSDNDFTSTGQLKSSATPTLDPNSTVTAKLKSSANAVLKEIVRSSRSRSNRKNRRSSTVQVGKLQKQWKHKNNTGISKVIESPIRTPRLFNFSLVSVKPVEAEKEQKLDLLDIAVQVQPGEENKIYYSTIYPIFHDHNYAKSY